MSIVETKTDYTPEDLLTMPDSNWYELVDGKLVEKQMGAKASYVASNCIFLLRTHLRENPSGWILDSEGGYECFPGHPHKLRRPDVSFIRFGRLPGEELPQGHVLIAPDLAVDIVSPTDTAYGVERKLSDWLSAKVPLIWLVYPDERTVRVHRADGTCLYLTENQELSGDDVLPGFHCVVRELFASPLKP